jgi:hypothetical protein
LVDCPTNDTNAWNSKDYHVVYNNGKSWPICFETLTGKWETHCELSWGSKARTSDSSLSKAKMYNKQKKEH